MEIHLSNEPVALMLLPNAQIKPFKIKGKGKYFTLARKEVRGIYAINNKYRYSWGKTPIYFYVAQEMNVIDPVMINEINKYRKKNKLTELKRKDIKHGSRLRTLFNQKKSVDDLKKQEAEKSIEMNGQVDGVNQAIDNRITELRTKHNKTIDPPDSQKAFVLLEHMRENGAIEDNEYTDFLNKVESNILTYDTMIDELREKHVVSVTEPLDENVEDFIQDLGSQNASEMAGLVDDLRINKRGLKDMTPVPIKAFMPASILFVIILGVLIGIPIMVSQWPLIEKQLSGSGGGGGLTMPWDLFGFIMHIPDYLVGLF